MDSIFTNLTSEQVDTLRKDDAGITYIKALGPKISFDALRQNRSRNWDIKDSLEWGKAVISTTPQMDQYLYSYGLMIKGHWTTVSKVISMPSCNNKYTLIDYGCGQGLAGLCLYDRFGSALLASIEELILIEPSPRALVRAEAVYRAMAPGMKVTCINSYLDDVTQEDIRNDVICNRIHVFSNVLDIPTFDHFELFKQGLSVGFHHIWAVGHDRDFDGGTPRLRELMDALHLEDNKHLISNPQSSFETFEYLSPSGQARPSVYWTANFERLDG